MTANDRPLVTKKGHEHGNTAQSGGLKLMTGVGPQHTPATRIWFGKASNPPGFRSLPHHHGEAETGAYLLSGRARIYFGKDYQEYVEMSEGDFMFVPPFIPHLEANMSTTEELWWLACRTPENIVVNLPDIEDSLLAGYRRREARGKQGHPVMTSITPFLWFDNNVPEAVAFYKSVFPNAKVETVNDFMASFELEGQKFNALNGGPKYRFNEAVSFFISVETQEEVDYFWNRLTADGGEESKCGWLKDKFGLSWQVVPTALGRYLSDPDRRKADRAMQAMMKMQKIVIADLDKAYAG